MFLLAVQKLSNMTFMKMKYILTLLSTARLKQTSPKITSSSLHDGFHTDLFYKRFKINSALYLGLLFLKTKRPFLLLWTIPFFSTSKKLESSSLTLQPKHLDYKKRIQNAILESDEFFGLNKFQEAASALLPFQDSKEVEVLWRLGRAQYKQSQLPSVKEPERRRLIASAYDALCEAVTRDTDHWAVHKWLSVLLDARSTYDGVKARVAQLPRVKEHMLRAAELNPKDATTFYMLGSWCYHIADMPWFQRKIAAAIFAEPPMSSFEEALLYFTKAEEVQPRFYSQNLLMVGKTLLKLQRTREAYMYFIQARDFPSSSDEDDQVRKEAADILKNLKANEEKR